MDILFIHGNYPGQFRNLATLLGRCNEHRIVFMTEREDAESEPIPGVKIQKFKCHRLVKSETHHYLKATEEAVLKGQAVVREIETLQKRGFFPKTIITHAGMGLGLFIKDIAPKSLHIGYFEWYFLPETTKNLLADYSFDAKLQTGLRNLPILQELVRCDMGVIPTDWQRQQFPIHYQKKLKVIFDGVDTSFFYAIEDKESLDSVDIDIRNRETKKVYKIKGNTPVMSYATRGMEPLRGFPEFMRSLPGLLKKHKTLNVFIAGADRQAYSYGAPNHNGSWKKAMLDELGEFEGKERVIFTGLLTYIDYRKLLWRTNLHCYFTRPYVTSWSLFEAASCGACMAISTSPATKGIVENDSVDWIDLDNPNGVEGQLDIAIKNKKSKRSKILKGFELSNSLTKWEKLINRGINNLSDKQITNTIPNP